MAIKTTARQIPRRVHDPLTTYKNRTTHQRHGKTHIDTPKHTGSESKGTHEHKFEGMKIVSGVDNTAVYMHNNPVSEGTTEDCCATLKVLILYRASTFNQQPTAVL